MTITAKALSDLGMVAKVSDWNGRLYVNLTNINRAFKADAATKIWIKGDVLTIETGKGYSSDAFIADVYALEAAVTEMGGSVRRA